MSDQLQQNTSTSDEIDLGKLAQLFRKILNSVFRGILRVFLFLKKHVIILGALIVIGVALGFMMNQLIDEKLKTEIIVKPNFESKDYLYDVVEEIQANVLAKDSAFFKNLDIDVNKLKNFKVEIGPIEDPGADKEIGQQVNEYLEILQNYKDNDFVLDVVKSEILKKSILTHRLTFSHKNPEKGHEYVERIVNYINSNPYFKELQSVSEKNAASRVEKNKELIGQIDQLVSNFSKGLTSTQGQVGQGMLVEGENGTDISSLLSFKSYLTKEIERKQIELAEHKEAISILNFGNTHIDKKPFLTKNIVQVPLILLGLFFLFSFISYLNKKSIEIA